MVEAGAGLARPPPPLAGTVPSQVPGPSFPLQGDPFMAGVEVPEGEEGESSLGGSLWIQNGHQKTMEVPLCPVDRKGNRGRH